MDKNNYILKDTILKKKIWKPQTLEKLTDWLLQKAYAQVYQWDLDKQTYRGLYRAIKYSKNLKQLNEFLIYELWYYIDISK